MLVLYSAVQARKKQIAEIRETGGWPQEDAEDQAQSHVALVQEMVTSFMCVQRQAYARKSVATLMQLVLFNG